MGYDTVYRVYVNVPTSEHTKIISSLLWRLHSVVSRWGRFLLNFNASFTPLWCYNEYNIPLKKSLNKIGVRLVNKCWMRFVAVMFVGLLESCCMCCSLVAHLLVAIRSKRRSVTSPSANSTSPRTYSRMFRRIARILCGNLWWRSQGIVNVLVYFVGMFISDIYLCVGYKL
jgi:hypothetical protein